MSKSLLNERISLCESIERLNDEGCFDVIRLLQKELGCGSLNQLLIRLIINLDGTSH